MRLDDGKEGEVSQRDEISRKFHDSKKKHEFEGISRNFREMSEI